MFLPRAIGHGAPAHLARISPTKPQWRATPLLRPTAIKGSHIIQHQRTQTTEKPHPRRRDGHVYPENLNIFYTGFAPIFVLGFTRVVSTVLFAVGTILAAPITFFDPHTPNYMIPVFAIGSAVPMVVSGLMIGGYVSHINIWLPACARRSKEGLMRFAEHVPPNTRLQVKSIWFRPAPHTREMEFRDLRRLPTSKLRLRLTNMEHRPLWNQNSTSEAERHPGWSWVARSWMGRYFVTRGMVRDRSRVPGVWDRMWEQIPVVGEEGVEEERKMEGRSVAKPVQSPSTASKKPPPRARPRP